MVVRYTYDSWGQVVKIEGTLKDKVGARNPFRYKGYYYDVETGLYYCRSRYYDPAIRRFISADDTQVLRDNLDMLGEKNLYAYCDDNPIIKGDSEGENPVITGIIGATVNIIAGGVAAVATGQKYSLWDIGIAGVSGFIAGSFGCSAKAIVKIGGVILSGAINAAYTAYSSYKRGDSFSASLLNTVTAFGATVFISNLTGFADITKASEKIVTAAWGLTHGVGAGLLAGSVSVGISNIASKNEIQTKSSYNKKWIGQEKYKNIRVDRIIKKTYKHYVPRNARVV